MIEEVFDFAVLDKLIEKGICFATYRLPNTDNIQIIIQSSANPIKISSYEHIGDQKGFVLAPFRQSENSSILLINPDIYYSDICHDKSAMVAIEEFIRGFENNSAPLLLGSNDDSKQRYQKAFTIFKKELKEKHFKKLVLARLEKIPFSASYSIGKLYYKALKNNPMHFVSLCHTPLSETWLSISPEILLSQESNRYETIALAGTRIVCGGEWDKKNKEEQKIVSDYMKQQLSKSELAFTEKGPFTVQSGNIEHIKTSFSFTDTKQKYTIGYLLNLLHPSPAVCGYPKQEAYNFICDHEKFDRSYYSGFLGPVNLEKQSALFVNLRCARIDTESISLYAGGGIMPESDLEKEWNETNNKIFAIKSLLE